MSASRQVVPQSEKKDRPLLVLKVKLVRVIVGSLILLGALGIFLIIDLLGPSSPRGTPDYRASGAIMFALFMIASPPIFMWARHAMRVTLTPEHLVFRAPGWLVRTIIIPVRHIRRVRVEKRLIRTRHFEYYRDFLIFTYGKEKTAFLRIIAYHSRDLWKLLTTLKQLAPHIKFDANIHRFLEDYCDDENTQLTSR